MEQKRGKVRAVAFYNPSDTNCSFSIPTTQLELGGKIKVRDLINANQSAPLPISWYTNSPHSVKILRLEAEQRLEPTHYEAEWAYLPCYNDLLRIPGILLYAPPQRCIRRHDCTLSGRTGRYYAEWNEVYSEKGTV